MVVVFVATCVKLSVVESSETDCGLQLIVTCCLLCFVIESCFVYSGAKLIVTVELVSFSHASDTTFLGDLRVA